MMEQDGSAGKAEVTRGSGRRATAALGVVGAAMTFAVTVGFVWPVKGPVEGIVMSAGTYNQFASVAWLARRTLLATAVAPLVGIAACGLQPVRSADRRWVARSTACMGLGAMLQLLASRTAVSGGWFGYATGGDPVYSAPARSWWAGLAPVLVAVGLLACVFPVFAAPNGWGRSNTRQRAMFIAFGVVALVTALGIVDPIRLRPWWAFADSWGSGVREWWLGLAIAFVAYVRVVVGSARWAASLISPIAAMLCAMACLRPFA